MSIYLFAFTAAALGTVLLGTLAAAALRAIHRTVALRRFEVRCAPTASPGEPFTVTARAVPRRARAMRVDATLSCTMLDHRAHELFSRTVAMESADGRDFSCTFTLPMNAPRTGRIGDELATLFSEDARRLLVSWMVQVEVRAESGRGRPLARRWFALEVKGGLPLAGDAAAVDRLVVGAFTDVREEMLFNWLVKVASEDGVIAPRERSMLRDVLRDGHGIGDAGAADARIAAELEREVCFDPVLLQRHVSVDARLAFCRLLYAVAWRDGTMAEGERAELSARFRQLGLSRREARTVEREVLLAMAQRALA